MLTECPHCLSVLKVSAELIYAGDPRVRCGECLRVFSAREHLTQEEANLDTTKIYQPAKTELATPEEPAFKLQPEVAQGLQALVDKPRNKNASSQTPQTPPTQARAHLKRPRRAAIPSRASDAKPKPNAATTQPTPSPNPAASDKGEQATGDSHRHISVLGRSGAGRSAPSRNWSVVTTLLLVALGLLAVDAVRSLTSERNLGDTLRQAWCGVSNCEPAVSRDFSKLQIVRRKIYAHPNAEGVLVISLAMINRQQSAMEYPTLQVRMTDQDGEVIARGHFEPAQYVTGFESGMNIQPERVVDVVLQVEDPGDAAQSFDLEFL